MNKKSEPRTLENWIIELLVRPVNVAGGIIRYIMSKLSTVKYRFHVFIVLSNIIALIITL